MSDPSNNGPEPATRVLLAGAGGQLGIALRSRAPDGMELLSLDRRTLDISESASVMTAAADFRPHWIINAAAYTAVDKAESERATAFSVNADGAENLARAAESVGARMVQISTDYVFDGRQSRPYLPDDAVNPVNVYGESKLAGETAVRRILGNEALILRTAWVYASRGRNFLVTMLRLMQEREELRVVEDQVGTPTHADDLADAILDAIQRSGTGTHHWTDAGVASWYDFAVAIQRLGAAAGLDVADCRIVPIPGTEYPTPAQRPPFTVLDKTSFRTLLDRHGLHWQSTLETAIARYRP